MNTDFEKRIVMFHIKKCIMKGKNYFKSRDIAEDVRVDGITSNKVASILYGFSQQKMRIKISKYTKSGSRYVWRADLV